MLLVLLVLLASAHSCSSGTFHRILQFAPAVAIASSALECILVIFRFLRIELTDRRGDEQRHASSWRTCRRQSH